MLTVGRDHSDHVVQSVRDKQNSIWIDTDALKRVKSGIGAISINKTIQRHIASSI